MVPADPTPIVNARLQDFVAAETNYQTITAPPPLDPTTGIPIPGTTTLSTENGLDLNTQPIGPPPGLDQGAVMPLQNKTAYAKKLPVLSVQANGTTVITVTCSAAHNLSNNSQVSVMGLSNKTANGFFSVTVTTATAFTYQISPLAPIAAGSLLTSTTNIITANVGLPYNYTQIPQTGI